MSDPNHIAATADRFDQGGALQPRQQMPPLIVRLEDVILRTNVLIETFVSCFFSTPWATLKALPSLFQGWRAFKRRIAEVSQLDVSLIPLHSEMVAHLCVERDRGRELHLYTTMDASTAARIVERLRLFVSIEGDVGESDLKGKRKLAFFRERFPNGFSYAGNNKSDLPIWQEADGIVLAGASGIVTRRAKALGKSIEAEFPSKAGSFHIWERALRVHQWTKNLLIYIPLLLAGKYLDSEAVLASSLGFVLLCTVASGTYLINDLADLAADRRHSIKHARPLASGDLPIGQAIIVAAFLIAVGVIGSFLLSVPFGAGIALYVTLTISYSLRLKRFPLFDVFILALLYTLRLFLGSVLITNSLSPWLLTFSMFFFFSLSLAKRHAELINAQTGERRIGGRGYLPSDAPLTLALGISSVTASSLILVLYMVEEAFPSGLYVEPERLWAAPMLVSLWTIRIWLLAHRGHLDEDPVAFALRDRISLALAFLLLLTFAVAKL